MTHTTIPISDLLHRALAAAKDRHAVDGPCMQLQLVKDIESAIGCEVPHGVLAIYATLGRPLGDVLALTDEVLEFYEMSESVNAPRSFDYVAFDAWGDWPRYYACWKRGDPRSSEKAIVWDLKTASVFDKAFDAQTMEAYFRGTFGVTPDQTESLPKDALDAWIPQMASVPVIRSRAQRPRTVWHRKFGDGTVLEEPEPGKIKVDFGEHGVRVLLERFVTDR